jgi:hypothetical protein
MFCIITNQTQANVWLTSVVLDQLLRRLILVTYASSQWRGKKFLIVHVINVKTLNGSKHDERSFFQFFLLKLKILEAKVKFWWGHTHDTTFSDKILDFYKILEESEQFFIFIFKENGKSEAIFQHFWSARRQFKKKITFWKKWSERIQRTKT